jgi:hypothetical protein
MTSIIDNLISDIGDDAFFKGLNERPKPPLGKYLQWYIESEKIALFKEGTPEEKLAHQIRLVPLKVENDISTKQSRFGQNINLFYPAKPKAGEDDKGGGVFNWINVVDATALDLGQGPMPSRAIFNAVSRSSTIDGQPSTKEASNERNDVVRPAFARSAISASLAQAAAGIAAQKAAFAEEHGLALEGLPQAEQSALLSEAGFKPDFDKIEMQLFAGHLFYATAVQNGEYINVESSTKKGGKPFARELPSGEVYGFASEE